MSRSRVVLIALVVAAATAPAARAADFHVSSAAELTSALSAAAANGTADRVLLAAGTYAGPFTYNSAESVEVLGAGQATTTITQTSNGFGLHLQNANATYHVADVGFALNGVNGIGLRIAGPGLVERVAGSAMPGSNGSDISIGHGGITVREATIQASLGGAGIVADTPGASTVTDSAIAGGGIDVEADVGGADLTLRRVRLGGPTYQAVAADFGATITITDSLIDLGATDGSALVAGDSGNTSSASTSSVVAARVTIIGDNSHHQVGAVVGPNSAGDNFSIALHDTVLVGMHGGALLCAMGAAGAGTITTDYSSVPAFNNYDDCTPGVTQTHPVATADVRFLDAAAGDYRLRHDSALIDAGDPAPLAAATDLGSLPRPVDGDGNGSATRDVGAYEYQRNPPVATATGGPDTVGIGEAVSYSGSATDADPGETATLTWAFDDGAAATGATASHAFATAGPHTATLTATDPAGATGTAQVQITVTAAPAVTGPVVTPPGGGGAAAGDVIAPVLAKVSLRKGIARFTLSEAATVTVTLARRAGKRYQRVAGRYRLAGALGANRVRLSAKRFARLRPGRYRATFVARDAAGNASHRVVRTFSVARSR
ncbi:MAG: hypothetical protein JWM73_2071 [Solirubrobacterales bacterium]|nr:hypothetical protein [Solirubrobacterales bacterium]